jgi:hypothetical protein
MNGGERSRVCFLPSVTLPANRRRGRQIPSPIHQISAGAAEIGRARFRSKPNLLDTYRRIIEYRIYEKKRNQKNFLENPMRSGKSDGIGEAFPRPCFIRKFLISPVYFPNLSYLCISSSTAESAPRTSQQQPAAARARQWPPHLDSGAEHGPPPLKLSAPARRVRPDPAPLMLPAGPQLAPATACDPHLARSSPLPAIFPCGSQAWREEREVVSANGGGR